MKNLFSIIMIPSIFKKKYPFLSIIFCISILFSACRHEPTPQSELKVKPKEGICLTQEFENNIWRFPLVDDAPDKTIVFKASVPDPDALYKVSLLVDYFTDIATDNLHLSITTITPDGNSSWNSNIALLFHEDKDAKEIGNENGKKINRITKELYNSRKMDETGEYTFEIYSSYTKMSLYGIKSISLKVEKQKEEK